MPKPTYHAVKSAYDRLTPEAKRKYIRFSDIKSEVDSILNAGKPASKPKQGWTFKGDWKNSVQPYYNR